MKNLYLIPIVFCLFYLNGFAQSQTFDYLDINQIKATILTKGDMFNNPNNSTPGYEFPKGSGKHSSYLTSIWVAGFDQQTNDLRVAAQTYRQNGGDFWPGPLNAMGQTDSLTAAKWDKIWKVNLTDITGFVSTTPPYTTANTPPSILDWPAKGNPYAKDKFGNPLPVTQDMAPFVDMNNDGLYNPLSGDFPLIKGEQALWRVFNDAKPHQQSGSTPMKLQISAMSYACNSNPSLRNVTYHSFEVSNFNANAYVQTRLAIHTDPDLGYGFDDYIGFDSSHRMGFIYNADAFDEGGISGYDSNLTQHGIVLLKGPLDTGNYKAPMGNFTFWNNAMGPTGNPDSTVDHSLLMRGFWRDAQPFTAACNSRDTNYAALAYAYPGDPCDTAAHSELDCGNFPGDRRFLMSSQNFVFPSGGKQELTFAVINTPRGPYSCSISTLKAMADTVSHFPEACGGSLPLSLSHRELPQSLQLFPNPAFDQVVVRLEQGEIKQVALFNLLGEQVADCSATKGVREATLSLQSLPMGLYMVRVQTEKGMICRKLEKK